MGIEHKFGILNHNELPKYGDKISWKDIKIDFIIKTYHKTYGYNDFKVVEYNTKTSTLTTLYNDKIVACIKVKHFINGNIGKIIGKTTKDFKIDIGTYFKDDKRDLVISNREYRKRVHTNNNSIINEKWYKYTCNKCGWTEGWIIEGNLTRGSVCSCCSNKTVVLGINTIWDTHKYLIDDFGLDAGFAKTNTYGVNKKGEFTCIHCGKTKHETVVHVIKNKTIGCTCGDGFSYPEKFMYSVLKQLGVDFAIQYYKDWCESKKYDFYIPSLNTIIETHGMQHYEENTNFKMSLKEQQENDRVKEQLAKDNGVNNYVVIDCRYSNAEHIVNNILKSKLNKLFDLSNVNFIQSDLYSISSNKIKEICKYWNNKEEWETTGTIAKNNYWGIKDVGTISDYLKRGAKLGWCNYNAKVEAEKSRFKPKYKNCSIAVFSKDGVLLGVYKSSSEIDRISEKVYGVKLFQSNVSAVCLGKQKIYKGFVFKYVNNKNQEIL